MNEGKLGSRSNQLEKTRFPLAVHHIKIFYNAQNKARLFYKFDGSIQFIKNIKK